MQRRPHDPSPLHSSKSLVSKLSRNECLIIGMRPPSVEFPIPSTAGCKGALFSSLVPCCSERSKKARLNMAAATSSVLPELVTGSDRGWTLNEGPRLGSAPCVRSHVASYSLWRWLTSGVWPNPIDALTSQPCSSRTLNMGINSAFTAAMMGSMLRLDLVDSVSRRVAFG